MILRVFLLIFVIRSVQLAPAKHIYEGAGQFRRIQLRSGRQAVSLNGFGHGTLGAAGGQLGYQQQAFAGQQALAGQQVLAGQQAYSQQYPAAGGSYAGFAANGFGQAQGIQSGLLQGQSLGFGQSLGLANGYNAQAPNIGFGPSAVQDQGLAQLQALQLAQAQSAAAQGAALPQGFDQSQALGQGQAAAGLNQGFDQNQALAQGLGQAAPAFNQGFPQDGQGVNQGFAQDNQGLIQGFAQGAQGLNQGFAQDNQGLAQGFDQSGQGLNQGLGLAQGFNQQPVDAGAALQNSPPAPQPSFADSGAAQQQQFPPLGTGAANPPNQDLINSFGGPNDSQEKPVEIGGKVNKNQQQQFTSPDLSAANNEDSEAPIITKDFFLHAAPDDLEDDELELKKLKLGPSRKHFNVVFIKAPALSSKSAAIKLLQAKNEEKTVIYVLSKQLDPSEIRSQIKSLPSHVSKPEVFFIKYRTPEEAQFAQQKIQAQFDSLGGTTRVSDEGLSPITSVVGALNGDGPDQQQIPDGGQQQFAGDQNQQFNNGQQQQQQPLDNGNGQQQQFQNGQDQFQQGLNGNQQINAGEGIIEPRIGGGDKPVLDGEAIGKVQNFGAAGQVDSSLLNRRLAPPLNKPRH